MFFDRRAFLEARRAEDPHGRLSDNDLERMADFEQLEWDIEDIECVEDAKSILRKLTSLVRAGDARR